MNVRNILAVLRRRWYLTLPAFVVILGAFVATFAAYPPQYASRAILVVTTPENGARIAADPRAGGEITNPLFNFQEGQSIAAAILIASAEAPAAQRRVGVEGTDTDYTVTNGDTNPEQSSAGPFIYIDATGRSPSAASDTSAAVVRLIRDDLRTRQLALRAAPATFLSVMDVVPPTAAEEQRGNRVVAAIAALVVSALLCCAVVIRVDRARRDRVRRGRGHRPRSATSGPRLGAEGVDADTETIAPSGPPSTDGARQPLRQRLLSRTRG